MEQVEPGTRIRELLDKYKYALLILAVGLCLMLLPEQKNEAHDEAVAAQTATSQESMESLLEEILSQVEGAGKVCVLLSEMEGSQTIYQTDTRKDTDESTTAEQIDTVIVTDANRSEVGLVRRTDPPKYLGAVIVCQGADRADVRLAVVEAVRCATGLGANQISVVKMK